VIGPDLPDPELSRTHDAPASRRYQGGEVFCDLATGVGMISIRGLRMLSTAGIVLAVAVAVTGCSGSASSRPETTLSVAEMAATSASSEPSRFPVEELSASVLGCVGEAHPPGSRPDLLGLRTDEVGRSETAQGRAVRVVGIDGRCIQRRTDLGPYRVDVYSMNGRIIWAVMR
jgi:hypothetical protein